MTRPLVFLDTETDGLGPDRKIWDIAIIRREPDGTEREWQAYVDINLSTANLTALYIGNFYDRHPMGRYLAGVDTVRPSSDYATAGFWTTSEKNAAATIAQLTHGATIVGAVPNFDTEGIEKLLRREGITPAWHHRLLCVETLTAGHLRRNIGGLDACAEALSIPPLTRELRHTALGDATWTKQIYDTVMTGKALAE